VLPIDLFSPILIRDGEGKGGYGERGSYFSKFSSQSGTRGVDDEMIALYKIFLLRLCHVDI